jgi:hypothetical protein
MTRYFPLAIVAFAAATALSAAARAEIAPQPPEELQKRATHIITGTVQFIGTEERREGDWLKTVGVVEIKVSKVEKGKRIEPGDAVYARFWKQAWVGKGNPPPFGSGHHLPHKGDAVRVYLKQSDGGYDALLPNGIELVAKPVAPTAPR